MPKGIGYGDRGRKAARRHAKKVGKKVMSRDATPKRMRTTRKRAKRARGMRY